MTCEQHRKKLLVISGWLELFPPPPSLEFCNWVSHFTSKFDTRSGSDSTDWACVAVRNQCLRKTFLRINSPAFPYKKPNSFLFCYFLIHFNGDDLLGGCTCIYIIYKSHTIRAKTWFSLKAYTYPHGVSM